MIVVPVGKTKLSHCLLGSVGVGQANVGTPVRVMFTEEVQLSVAVATPSSSSSVAVQLLVVAFTSGGTVSAGASVSTALTWIFCVQEALPSVFVAVQVMKVSPAG